MRAAQKTSAGDLQETGLRAKHSGTLQCWRGERGLGREENNASEADVSFPPQKAYYRE